MKKIIAFIVFFSFLKIDSSFSQNNKYWVMFTDKNGTPYSVATPTAYLSTKSILRRTTQGIAINNSDLPVTPAYVAQLAAVPGVTVLYRSKWLNGAVVLTSTTSITTINTFSFVSFTNRVNKYRISLPVKKSEAPPVLNTDKTQGVTATTGYNYGGAACQVSMLGVDCMHNMGFRGQGMTIAVMDVGFDGVNTSSAFDSLYSENRLLGSRNFVTGDTLVFNTGATHGTEVLSTLAANSPGNIIGTAPKAKYWLLVSEYNPTETISEEYNWVRAAEFADSVGVDITTTSLGYTTFDPGPPSLNNHYDSIPNLNGRTAPMSIAANMAARKGIFVLNAAGNEGQTSWYYIGVPADADSICTVGAVDCSENHAGFSSYGPTADGRIKPDLCAVGSNAWLAYPGPSFGFGSGTSFATPILAGAVACLWQAKPGITNMQLLKGLKQYASNSLFPNNSIGWGIPNICYTKYMTIGVKEYSLNQMEITLYPNPASNQLNINLSSVSNAVSLKVTDLVGKEIKCEILNSSETGYQINTNALSSGAYFVIITDQNHSITKKFMKQ